MIDVAMDVKSKKSSYSEKIIRSAQLDVAEELRRQELEIERVDTALSFLEEMESNELGQELLLDESYEFRGFRKVHEELNQYMTLVQEVVNLARRNRSDCSKHEYIADNFVEKTRDDSNIRIKLDDCNAAASVASSWLTDQHLTDSRMSHLAIIPTTTVHISPGFGDAISKCGNRINIKPKEVLLDARQSVHNHRIHCASESGSLIQLVRPAATANQKSHPFLSQAASDSHSLHAAMQHVLGSLKRTLPGFHPIASNILSSGVVDFISTFAVALRRYDDSVRSQIKLLLEKYDSSVSSTKRSELVCEIDHLHKISRSATTKREQLLDICRGPYYQATNCPLLRQMKILHSTFSSNSS